MDTDSCERSRCRRGVTFVELILALSVSICVLGCFWFLVTALHGQSGASSLKARQALELTEFCELLVSDLYHARYVAYEGPESSAALGLVTRRLDRDGAPRRDVVCYRVGSEGRTLLREEKTGARKTVTVNQPDEIDSPIRIALEAGSGRLGIELGGRQLDFSMDRELLAPTGERVAELADSPRGDERAAGGTDPVSDPGVEGAIQSSSSAGDAAAWSPELGAPAEGESLPETRIGGLDDMAFQFLAGGDEQPYEGAFQLGRGFEMFSASSNLDYQRRRAPVVFAQRFDPDREDARAVAALPNPVLEAARRVTGLRGGEPPAEADPAGGAEGDGPSAPFESGDADGARGKSASAADSSGVRTFSGGSSSTSGAGPASGSGVASDVTIADVDRAIKRFLRNPGRVDATYAVIKEFLDAGSPGVGEDGSLPPGTEDRYPYFSRAYDKSRGLGASWGRPGSTNPFK